MSHLIVIAAISALTSFAMHELLTHALDSVAGISPKGWLARELIDTIRLVYYRGLFDGFVAGFVVTVLSLRGKSRP